MSEKVFKDRHYMASERLKRSSECSSVFILDHQFKCLELKLALFEETHNILE